MSQTNARRSRAKVLFAVLVVEVGALAWLLSRDVSVRSRVGAWQRARSEAAATAALRQALAKDPRVGAPAPPLRAGNPKAQSLPASTNDRDVIVVFIGSCTSCTADSLMAWSRTAERGLPVEVLAVSHQRPAAIEAFLKEHELAIPVLADPSGQASTVYNVVFTPRAYYVRAPTVAGEAARIAWIQPTSGMSPHACLQACGVLAEGGEAHAAQ